MCGHQLPIVSYLHVGRKWWEVEQLGGDEVLEDDGVACAIVAADPVLDEIVEIA